MDNLDRPAVILVVIGRNLRHDEGRGTFAHYSVAYSDTFIHVFTPNDSYLLPMILHEELIVGPLVTCHKGFACYFFNDNLREVVDKEWA